MIDYFNRNWTNQLKGVAITIIILGHLSVFKHFIFAQSGVGIFLLISGFGLTQSYFKNGTNDFFKKRFIKVLLPYSLITTFWIILDMILLNEKYTIFSATLKIIGFNFIYPFTPDASMWYITFILIWYLIFYVVFRFVHKDVFKLGILFLMAVVLFKFGYIFPVGTTAGMYTIEFPLGVLLGLYCAKLPCISKNTTIAVFAILGVISGISLYVFRVPLENIGSFTVAIGILCLTLIFVCSVGILSVLSIRLKAIEFIGKISFEMYLVEFMFMTKYKFLLQLGLNFYVARGIYLLVMIGLGVVLNKLIKAVFSLKLYRRKEVTVS